MLIWLIPHLAITGYSVKVITIYKLSFFLNTHLWLHQVLVVTCGIQFLDQGLNLVSLNLEHGILITDYQGSPLYLFLNKRPTCAFKTKKQKKKKQNKNKKKSNPGFLTRLVLIHSYFSQLQYTCTYYLQVISLEIIGNSKTDQISP